MATIKNVSDLVKKTLGDVELDIHYDYQKDKPDHHDFVQYILRKH